MWKFEQWDVRIGHEWQILHQVHQDMLVLAVRAMAKVYLQVIISANLWITAC